MRINIISVGKLNKDFAIIANDYLKMLKWQVKCHEITYAKKLPSTQIKQYEAELIAKYLNNNAYNIVLDVKGKEISSEEFSNIISKQMMMGKGLNFIIGGAFGLDLSIIDLAQQRISLSKMTYTHQFAKIILLEQLYRAETIINNHPYHK